MDYPPCWHEDVRREVAGYMAARAALLAVLSAGSRGRRRDRDEAEAARLARTVDGYADEYERLFGEARRQEMLAAARAIATGAPPGFFRV